MPFEAVVPPLMMNDASGFFPIRCLRFPPQDIVPDELPSERQMLSTDSFRSSDHIKVMYTLHFRGSSAVHFTVPDDDNGPRSIYMLFSVTFFMTMTVADTDSPS